MKNVSRILKFSTAFLLLSTCIFYSCVKKDFDQPLTSNLDPNLTANTSISQLAAMANGTVPTLITTNVIICGVVIADDASGNFYKQMIIEDATGGLNVQLDESNYNTFYPIGRRIFIQCNGLYIAADAYGNYQLGSLDAGTIGRIPQTLIAQYLIPGKWGVPVTPNIVSLGNNAALNNTLIQINNVEFQPSDTLQPYANASTLASINRLIEDCCGHSLDLYSSGYANFATTLTPSGKGSIIAVYTTFKGNGELEIRNANDIQMSGPRCNGIGNCAIGSGALMNITNVRNLPSGVFQIGTKIQGTVISNSSTSNIYSHDIVLQDGTGGIDVSFTSTNTFLLSDSLIIDVSGDSLTVYNGLMEINNANISNAIKLGTGSITPRVATTAAIIANQNQWESTLLTITNVTLSAGAGGAYGGSVTMTDATGSLELYTKTAASFAAVSYPTTTVSVTGYLTHYLATPELSIRDTSDVK